MTGSLLGKRYAFQFLKVTYCPPGRWNLPVTNVDIELTAVSSRVCLQYRKPWVRASEVHEPGLVAHACTPSTWERGVLSALVLQVRRLLTTDPTTFQCGVGTLLTIPMANHQMTKEL